jgi:hypothetical protein
VFGQIGGDQGKAPGPLGNEEGLDRKLIPGTDSNPQTTHLLFGVSLLKLEKLIHHVLHDHRQLRTWSQKEEWGGIPSSWSTVRTVASI